MDDALIRSSQGNIDVAGQWKQKNHGMRKHRRED